MKILLHTQWGLKQDFVGGTERFVINIAKSVKNRGDEALIVCSNLEDLIFVEGVPVYGVVPHEYRDKVRKYGCANEHFFKNEIIGKEINSASVKCFSSYVLVQIREFDFDIAHLNSFLYCSSFDNAPFSKIVVTNHENDQEIDHYWGTNSFVGLTELVKHNNSLRKLKKRIVPSRYYAKMFTSIWGIPIEAVPSGIDSSYVGKIFKNKELRREYASDDEIIVLLPSRFDIAQKGHDIAIQAASILKKRGIKLRWIFSGFDSDTYSTNLKLFTNLLKEFEVENEITLTKFNHMREAYSIADIVISPERFCSYGFAVLESLALGLPTILTPIPTYREIGNSYSHAYFSKDHSAEEFVNTILKVIKSGIWVYEQEAERFRTNHSLERSMEEYYKIYLG